MVSPRVAGSSILLLLWLTAPLVSPWGPPPADSASWPLPAPGRPEMKGKDIKVRCPTAGGPATCRRELGLTPSVANGTSMTASRNDRIAKSGEASATSLLNTRGYRMVSMKTTILRYRSGSSSHFGQCSRTSGVGVSTSSSATNVGCKL